MSEGVPEGWQVSRLGRFVSLQGGNAFKSSEFNRNGIPVVRISNIKNGRVDLSDVVYIKPSDEFYPYQLNPNDILLAMSGATTGKVGIYTHRYRAYLNQRVGRFLRRLDSKIDISFLFQLVRTDRFMENVLIDAIGGAQPNISSSQVESIAYAFPPFPEQKKIAAILTSVDEVIEKTEAQINKLQDLKKAMMQTLLTEGIGHTEFKDSPVGRIPKGWDFLPLGEKVTLIPGFAFKSTDFIKSGVPLIRMGNLYQNNLDLDRNPIHLPASFVEIYNKFTVHPQDIVMSMTGTCGKEDYGFAVQSPSSHPICMLNQRVVKIINNPDIDRDFLLALLHSRLFLDEIYAVGAGTKQANLSSANILNVWVPFPGIVEQRDIGQAFISIDSRISSKSKKSLHTKQLKKALMQDLLTGKVRVKLD